MENKIYASFWIRFFAFAVEKHIFLLDSMVLLLLLSIYWSKDIFTFIPALIGVLVYAAFMGIFKIFVHIYLISNYGGDLGKLLFNLKVEHEDGSKLTYKRTLFREFIGKIASGTLFGVGYFWIFKNAKKQAWHDMLSDTYVVKKNGIWLGICALILFVVINCTLLFASIRNFSQNRVLGSQIVELFKDMNREMTPKKAPTSITSPTLDQGWVDNPTLEK